VDAGSHAAESCRPAPATDAVERLDKLRHAKGRPTERRPAAEMQKTMQNNCAVFRTGETLDEGVDAMEEVWPQALPDIGVHRPSHGLEHRSRARPGPSPRARPMSASSRSIAGIPDDGENPRVDTYWVDMDTLRADGSGRADQDQERDRPDADLPPLLPRGDLRLLRDEHRRDQHARLHLRHGRDQGRREDLPRCRTCRWSRT
jgi:hypothetical protein